MNEKDEDAVHAGIVSKSQKIPEFRPIWEFATDRRFPDLAPRRLLRAPEPQLLSFKKRVNEVDGPSLPLRPHPSAHTGSCLFD
jgi:hypothetical protein